MNQIDVGQLEQGIREGIQLLKSISESRAFTPKERKVLVGLVDGYMDKINHVKLRLGIIGEFNAGKSTLLNAILGKVVVATSDRPCTPVPVYINGGREERLSVRKADGSIVSADPAEYARYTTDGEAPPDVQSIEMVINSRLLIEHKLTLIDTPGINAINPLHTQITESVLPEMHAAILLMYSKQPGSKSTLEFLKNAASQMGKIFVCISKSDFLSAEQIDRLVQALPGRLSQHAGVTIPRIYPIHFDEDGGGEDFQAFMQELNTFMLTQWYQSISKDLGNALQDYAERTQGLVQNRLELEERLFFEFMKRKPVHFDPIAQKLNGEVAKAFEARFDEGDFKGMAAQVGNNCIAEIRAQLQKDLKPDKVVMLVFDQRVDKRELERAAANCNAAFKAMTTLNDHMDGSIQQFIKGIRDASVEALQQVNETLVDFRGRVKEEITSRPEVIQQAQAIRKARWSWTAALIAVALILSMAALHFHPSLAHLAIAAAPFVALAGLPFWVSRNPAQTDLDEIAEEKMKDLQCFSIPEFSKAKFGTIDLRDLTASSFFGIKHGGSINATGGQVARMVGNNIGFGAGLEVAAIIGAFSFFTQPKAKDVYREILQKAESEVLAYQEESHRSFLEMKTRLLEVSNQYIQSLPERFSVVINEAFQQNQALQSNRQKTMSELETYVSRLASIKAPSYNESNSF